MRFVGQDHFLLHTGTIISSVSKNNRYLSVPFYSSNVEKAADVSGVLLCRENYAFRRSYESKTCYAISLKLEKFV